MGNLDREENLLRYGRAAHAIAYRICRNGIDRPAQNGEHRDWEAPKERKFKKNRIGYLPTLLSTVMDNLPALPKLEIPYPVVLASGSPRRKDLMRAIVSSFEISIPDVDETLAPYETLDGATQRLATLKATAILAKEPKKLIIAADTLVGVDIDGVTEILAKPIGFAGAARMLRSLSDRTHRVVTGVAIGFNGVLSVFSETTWVTFHSLSDQQIRDYVLTGEPMDKAGGYAIQGGASSFVKSVDGLLTNVIGLPVERVSKEIEKMLEISAFRSH